MTDPIVADVCDEYQRRSQVGIAKYGVTLARTDLSLRDWLNHAREEAMDLVLYLTRAIKELDAGEGAELTPDDVSELQRRSVALGDKARAEGRKVTPEERDAMFWQFFYEVECAKAKQRVNEWQRKGLFRPCD